MIKAIKKAFTLVELLVVIAILAILATVGIVSYSSFKEKAQVSNDVGLVTQLNRFVYTKTSESITYPTPYSLMEDLVNDKTGIDLSELDTFKGDYHYAFNINKDVQKFFLVNNNYDVVENGNVVTNKYNKNAKLDFFVFVKDSEDAIKMEQAGYSVYLQNGTYTNETFASWEAGLDVGDNKISAINYVNTTGSNRSVTFRTIEGTLTINAPLDNVYHYGFANEVILTSTATTSYHELGSTPIVSIKRGRLALESGCSVQVVHFASTEVANEPMYDDIRVAIADGVDLPIFARDRVEIPEHQINKMLVVELQHGLDPESCDKDKIYLYKYGIVEQMIVEEVKTSVERYADEEAVNDDSQQCAIDLANCWRYNGQDYKYGEYKTDKTAQDGVIKVYLDGTEEADKTAIADAEVTNTGMDFEAATKVAAFAGGTGTENDPYLISNPTQWNNIYPILHETTPLKKITYFKLVSDVDFTDYYIDNSPVENDYIYINMDGNGHELKNVSKFAPNSSESLFNLCWNITLSNMTIDFEIVSDGRSGYVGGISKELGCTNPDDKSDKAVFTNITTTGSIIRDISGFTGVYTSELYCNATFNNCANHTSLVSTSYVASIAPHCMAGGSQISLTFNGYYNFAPMYGAQVGGIFAMYSGDIKPLVTGGGVVNYGKIYSTTPYHGCFDANGNTFYDSNNAVKDVKGAESATTLTVTPTTITLGEFGDTIKTAAVANATRYAINMSFATGHYDYTPSSGWGGGFYRTLSKTYSAEYMAAHNYEFTNMIHTYIGEVKNDKQDFWSNDPVAYNGLYVSDDFSVETDGVEIIDTFTNGLYLISYEGKTFYYYNLDAKRALLDSSIQEARSTGKFYVTVTVTAYKDNTIIGYRSTSYYYTPDQWDGFIAD